MIRRMLFGVTTSLAAWAVLSAAGCGGQVNLASKDAGREGAEGAPSGAAAPSEAAPGDGSPASPGPEAGVLPPPVIVNKVDLLFDIDNSASMGDKQAYLAQAIPDLLARLITPDCVDGNGNGTGVVADANGNCSIGTAEFPGVHDLHIGIVTSSLGPRLGDACPTTGASSTQAWTGGTLSRHNDDQGHLINRASDPSQLSNYTETSLADLGTANFLDWFPQDTANLGAAPSPGAQPIGNAAQLPMDFQSMVVGVHAFGCGIESQLESWYRFLVQPDPYATLAKDSTNRTAEWSGVDTVLLAQRADFLRPDSLVAVIVLSDENDSEVDVRSFGQTGWNFMSTQFKPPRGTSVCATNPSDPSCTSCAFPGHQSDPNCMTNAGVYTALNDWGFDLNLRHVHQKQKYGVEVQYPIQRYVLGLTSPKVPDRNGEYPPGASNYAGLTNPACTNPLFAAKLPAPPAGSSTWNPTADELCNLAPGTRTAGSVYYSHIGGVPHQLLQVDPTDPDSPQKATLTAADWTLILGKDPLNYDYTGIDPHMVESYQPRVNTPVPLGGFGVSATNEPTGTDPISGREWITDSMAPQHQGLIVDREYACTFKLAAPRDCSAAASSADPTLFDSCDCQPPVSGTGAFTHDQVPAVCNDAVPTQQDFAKAYPTIRELLLAKLLGDVPGANEGVISSICPIHTLEGEGNDPLYGYRPAVSAIVNRLKRSL